MKYIALISTAESLGTIRGFVVSQLENHFKSWSSLDKDAGYTLYWRRNSLVLETESAYILNKWLNVEKRYLEYLLDDSKFTLAHNIKTMRAA